MIRGQKRPPVLLRQTRPHTRRDLPKRRRADTVRYSLPGWSADLPEPTACLPPCLPVKKWCCHSPPAPRTEPILLPPPPLRTSPDLLWLAVGGSSADVEPATQRSTPVSKHRRRRWNVFPVISRISSALRAPSCPPLATPKVGWDA